MEQQLVKYLLVPNSDAHLIAGITDELKLIAEKHHVSFYVNAKEEEEKHPVVVNKRVAVPPEAEERLRALATKTGVTIYVNPESLAL